MPKLCVRNENNDGWYNVGWKMGDDVKVIGPDGDYPTIQEGIDSVGEGDHITLLLASGVVFTENLTVEDKIVHIVSLTDPRSTATDAVATINGSVSLVSTDVSAYLTLEAVNVTGLISTNGGSGISAVLYMRRVRASAAGQRVDINAKSSAAIEDCQLENTTPGGDAITIDTISFFTVDLIGSEITGNIVNNSGTLRLVNMKSELTISGAGTIEYGDRLDGLAVQHNESPSDGDVLTWVDGDSAWEAAAPALADHTHSGAGSGGQLDWDNIWTDAVHDHSSNAEGGAKIDLNGAADGLVLDADGDTSISAPTDDQIDIAVGGADRATLTPSGLTLTGWSAGAASGFLVKNTSGAAAAANDVGYIDSAGEYKTTTTEFDNVAWCVVLVGGANNADIYVARRGRVTVALNGNCSAGNYLYTSTTAGQAEPQTYVRPEVFGIALTANAGGAGGTCTALLLMGRTQVPIVSTDYVYGVNNASTSDFVSTIATLPGGAVLTYGAVTSGNANTLVPWAGLTIAGHVVLTNTTRGTSALISAVVTGTSTITLTANVPAGWQVNDTITARSQTCTGNPAASTYFYEYNIASVTGKPVLAVAVIMNTSISDSAAGASMFLHPYETYSASKTCQFWTQVATQRFMGTPTTSVNNNIFCLAWNATGAGTTKVYATVLGWIVATP